MFKYYINDLELDKSYFNNDNYSYRLDSEGDSLEDLLNNAYITVVDGYQIELFSFKLNEHSDEVMDHIEKITKQSMKNIDNERQK